MSQNNPLLELSNAFADAAANGGRSTVAVNARQRIPSSGILWRAGVVVTAEHTLKRDDEITVTLPDNRTVPATLAGRDTGSDLAVLRVAEALVDASVEARTKPQASLQVGQMVMAIGRRGENGVSASAGVISAVSGPWRTWRGGLIDQFIRPDTSIYPGMSGGPLVSIDGTVIGMNTSALTRSSAVTIPSSVIDRITSELISKGHIARGYLGVGLHPVQLPGGRSGLIVLSVEEGGPADRGGLFIGDVLVALEGTALNDTDDVQSYLGAESVGKPLRVTAVRGASTVELDVSPTERKQGGR